MRLSLLALLPLAACGSVYDQAAMKGYYNTTQYYADGSLDCDDAAKTTYDYLKTQGKKPHYRFCQRNGNGHIFVVADGMAFDNSKPYPITVAEVGCD